MTIGLVGCGRWGRFVLRDLVALGEEVVAVARSEASRARAAEGGASRIVDDVRSLPKVSGIVVATRTSEHAGTVAAALRHGVPVFVEKPLTDDPGTARALAEQAPHRLFVMDKWRYHPAVEAMRLLRDSGELGRLEAIQTRRLSWGQSHDDVDAVWVLLPHDLAIVREIAGFLPAAVAAVGTKGTGQDAALTGLLASDGLGCVVEVSSVAATPERRITCRFSAGVAEMSDPYATTIGVTRFGSSGTAELRPIPGDMPLLAELQTFVAHLAGGPPPRSSAADGAETVVRIAELRSMAGI